MNAMPAEVSVDIKDIVRLKKWFWAMTGHIKQGGKHQLVLIDNLLASLVLLQFRDYFLLGLDWALSEKLSWFSWNTEAKRDLFSLTNCSVTSWGFPGSMCWVVNQVIILFLNSSAGVPRAYPISHNDTSLPSKLSMLQVRVLLVLSDIIQVFENDQQNSLSLYSPRAIISNVFWGARCYFGILALVAKGSVSLGKSFSPIKVGHAHSKFWLPVQLLLNMPIIGTRCDPQQQATCAVRGLMPDC